MKTKILLAASLFGTMLLSAGKTITPCQAASVDKTGIDNVFNWVSSTDSFFDADGAHGIRKASSGDLYANGIGLKQQFNLEEGKTVSITFQIPDYEDSTRVLRANHVANKFENGDMRPYDIYLHNCHTNENVIYRIWSGNSSVVGQTSSYVQFIEQKTSGWETYEGGWFSGVFTNGSSFTFTFDTTNFMSFYVGWTNKMTPFYELDSASAIADKYKTFMQNNFSDVEQIEFWFAHQKLEADTYNEVVIKEINGQSLAVNEDKFNDDKAPIVAPIHESNADAKYEVGVEYSMRLEQSLNTPSTSAEFYSRPASDATCPVDALVSNSKLFGKLSTETEWKELGAVNPSSSMIEKISFDKVGTWDLKLEVKDNAGNAGYSSIYNVQVAENGAEEYATKFLSAFTCDPTGATKPTFNIKEGTTYWSWDLLAEEFELLSDANKEKFKSIEASSTGTNIEKVLSKYDYIIFKYGVDTYSNFMNRGVSPSYSFNQVPFTSTSNNEMILTIALVASISISFMAAIYIFSKKRKHN